MNRDQRRAKPEPMQIPPAAIAAAMQPPPASSVQILEVHAWNAGVGDETDQAGAHHKFMEIATHDARLVIRLHNINAESARIIAQGLTAPPPNESGIALPPPLILP